jgi:Tfp pilus assembly protein PilN
MSGSLNLSRRPFLNGRPVSRAALLLWLLGAGLLLLNVSLFWEYFSGSADKRAQIAKANEDIQRERQSIQQLEAQLASFNLDDQNERIDFLNRKIAERTFSWSVLLDRLAAVMPNDVRLVRLTPSTDAQAGPRRTRGASSRRARMADGRVLLNMAAEARRDEAFFQFVQRLSGPHFEEANFTGTSRDPEEGDLLRFNLTVEYLPSATAPQGIEEPGVEVIEEPLAPAEVIEGTEGAPR